MHILASNRLDPEINRINPNHDVVIEILKNVQYKKKSKIIKETQKSTNFQKCQ